MENVQGRNSVPIGIGIGIGQDQIDDIEDLQSPPNSPGLVLPRYVPSTNDKIDFFALDPSSSSDIKDELEKNALKSSSEENGTAATPKYSTSPSLSSIPNTFRTSEKTTYVLDSKDDQSNSKHLQPISPENGNELKDVNPKSDQDRDLNLNLTTSADSYYSRSRKGIRELNSPKHINKLRHRRISDVSDKSERSVRSDYYGSIGSNGSFDSGSASGSFFSDSDVDIYGSSIMKDVNRKSTSGSGSQSHDLTPIRSFEDGAEGKHFDDGIVYRATSAVSESLPSTPRSRSRSSSRSRSDSRSGSRSRRRSRDDGKDNNEKDKEGDASATAQIFKNMLILEESLRQQYIQQQNLRYKYSLFLVVMVIIFMYSTYMSLFHPMYVELSDNDVASEVFSNSVKSYDDLSVTASELQSGVEASISKSGIPDFPLIARLTEGLDNFREDDKKKPAGFFYDTESDAEVADGNIAVDVRDTKYALTNIMHRVISIIMFMTLLLFYLTGEYTRTISIPRKFLVTTNKGIRQLNVRLVKVKVPMKERIIGFIHLQLQNQRQGVDHARLVLNPRIFSTATREQWELYRNQFWGLESVRNRITSAKKGKKC